LLPRKTFSGAWHGEPIPQVQDGLFGAASPGARAMANITAQTCRLA